MLLNGASFVPISTPFQFDALNEFGFSAVSPLPSPMNVP